MRNILLVIVLALVAGFAYIRLAPPNITALHKPPTPNSAGDYIRRDGVIAIRAIATAPSDILRAVDTVILRSPRTIRVAGAVDTGIMTYETRSRLFGFPDYTTVNIIKPGEAVAGNDGPLLVIHARLRFGVADMGVNAARVHDWLAELGPLVAPSPSAS